MRNKVADVLEIGGLAGGERISNCNGFRMVYHQGYRVYSIYGVSPTINLGAGPGGSSGLFVVNNGKERQN